MFRRTHALSAGVALLAAGVLAAGLGRALPAVLAAACALAALGARRLRLPPGCDRVVA